MVLRGLLAGGWLCWLIARLLVGWRTRDSGAEDKRVNRRECNRDFSMA
jgi:hypothetical protein